MNKYWNAILAKNIIELLLHIRKIIEPKICDIFTKCILELLFVSIKLHKRKVISIEV